MNNVSQKVRTVGFVSLGEGGQCVTPMIDFLPCSEQCNAPGSRCRDASLPCPYWIFLAINSDRIVSTMRSSSIADRTHVLLIEKPQHLQVGLGRTQLGSVLINDSVSVRVICSQANERLYDMIHSTTPSHMYMHKLARKQWGQ